MPIPIGKQIKFLREAAGLSQFGLSKLINVHPATISLWETGNREPDLAMVGGTTDRPRVTLEMQRTPKGKIMFMNVMMTSKDFAYLDRGIFIVNGRRYDTPALDPFGDFCFHDVFNGYIIESLYFLFSDPAVAAIVDAIRNAGVSGVVEYRFYGEKRSFSGIMSEGEKQVWLDMLEYYDFYDVPVL